MIENEIIKLQIVSSIKLLVSAYLLFYWIPKRVLPQEYIDNRRDRLMFNIIHMVAIITLLFPLFIYLRIFGFLFLIIFFIFLKLFFLKFYYKKEIFLHFRNIYINLITRTLMDLENPGSIVERMKTYIAQQKSLLKSRITRLNVIYFSVLFIIVIYALYLRMYRGYVSLVGAVPDMYGFYYWNNILKINILFPENASYMWSAPVLIFTVNLFAHLNTVVLYNIFPLLYLLFTFFSIYYILTEFFELSSSRTASVFVALIFFGVILASPLSQQFFGFVFRTSSPKIIHFLDMAAYWGVVPEKARIYDKYPFYFFWRFTTTLPYEIAASFFLVNIFFLAKFIQSKKSIFLLVYAESLAIIFAIHGGIALPLLCPSLLIFLYSVITRRFDLKSLTKLLIVIILATIIGNTWLLQLITTGIPQHIGKAAPILDKLLGTKQAAKEVTSTDIYSVQLVSSTIWLSALIVVSFALLIASNFYRKLRFPLAILSLTSLGTLFIYFSSNLGLPLLVDHSRLQVYIAYSYAIISGGMYFLVIEKGILKSIFKYQYLRYSLLLCLIAALYSIAFTPRWMDTQQFWESIHAIEYEEFPYLVIKIEDGFQPFSYTVVSYVQQFSEIVSKGFHINTQDFLQMYTPADPSTMMPTDYVFIFIENSPKDFGGLGEYWYRWRRDIMLKLKDWVAIYSQSHDNIKLWYKSQWVEVYLIDNRSSEDSLFRQREALKDTGR
jgi:hypothetical protein